MPKHRLVALDLFAGTGWGVACQALGIEEHGVELMPEAVATRAANGMSTLYRDVWHGLEHEVAVPDYDILIASPPCQTFSMAGNGAGRKALDEVLALINSRAYLDVAALRAFGEAHDMRTALVLTPLAHVARDTPTYVVLEQVPQVLPVWQRCAVELRKWGYSVVVGVLNSEQYGVPQTRKRAILIARADGVEARMPTPTHSRYYSTNPAKLDEGVLPWVSMAEALGWGRTARPSVTVTGGGTPKTMHEDSSTAGGHHTFDPAAAPAHTVTGIVRGWKIAPREGVVLVSNYSAGGEDGYTPEGNKRPRSTRAEAEPSVTVTSKAGSMKWRDAAEVDFVSNNKLAHSARRRADEPAPTITAGHDSANREWQAAPGSRYFHPMTYGRRGLWSGDEPAPTIRGVQRDMPATYEPHERDAVSWVHGESGEPIKLDSTRPVTTVAADPRLSSREHHYHGEQNSTSTRVTVDEAAALQSYPPSFDWAPILPVLRLGVDTGRVAPLSKSKAFLQIGNAVPPLLAAHILASILEDMEN